MPIRNLDDDGPQSPDIPVDEIPDEQLLLDGRIRDLFNRVLLRKKSAWDPSTRTRQPMNKRVAEITDEKMINESWKIIEEDALAHYKAGNYECWIVRFGAEKYACEVFKDGITHDSFIKRDFESLAGYLLKTYISLPEPVMTTPPIIVKRKPGRPKREESLPEPVSEALEV